MDNEQNNLTMEKVQDKLKPPRIRKKQEMPRWCKICKGRSNLSIKLHRFPLHEDLKKKWADFCNEKVMDLTKSTLLCSLHFEPPAFRKFAEKEKSKRLRPNAVPTLFGPEEVSQVYGSTFIPKSEDFNQTESDTSKNCVSPKKKIGNSPENIPSTVEAYLSRKGNYPRSLNDLKTSDCGTSEQAKMILDIARKDVERLRKRHHTLTLDNLLLHKRISSLEKEMQRLEQSGELSDESPNEIEEIFIQPCKIKKKNH